MKFFLILAILALPLHVLSNRNEFSIDSIVESSPFYIGDVYRLPLLKGEDKNVANRINSHFISDFLRIEYGSEKVSVFENVWGSVDEPYPSMSEITYSAHLINDKIFCLTFDTYWCGAYCEGYTESYSYDLSTGSFIELDALIDENSKALVLSYFSMVKRNRILNHINEVRFDLEYGTPSENDRRQNENALRMYQECLEYSDYSSFEYFDYSFHRDSVFLRSSRCSNHADRPFDDIWDFKYKFKLSEIQQYFSVYGKEILL